MSIGSSGSSVAVLQRLESLQQMRITRELLERTLEVPFGLLPITQPKGGDGASLESVRQTDGRLSSHEVDRSFKRVQCLAKLSLIEQHEGRVEKHMLI